MPKLVPIVEGDGEVSAAPLLIRRILWDLGRYDLPVIAPKNAHGRGNLEVAGGLEKFIKYAWKERDCGAILVLIDADRDCARELAKTFSKRVEAMGIVYPVVIICAKHEYETWFLASLETISGLELSGRAGLRAGLAPQNVEEIVSPKAVLNRYMSAGRAYKETEDQEPMTQLLDITLVKERSRSFRRMCHAVEQAVGAIDNDAKTVTP
ncbi:MAG TPA: DUF4276 family protein [Pyrinomonadaceae bacterium]|nr:DUF4276 family protein [Pyrinomonadaceae bacterium]